MAWLVCRFFLSPSSYRSIFSIHSTIARAQSGYNIDTLRHPQLSDQEMHAGAKLGWDIWADTGCAGRHAFVEDFIEGTTVTASGFANSLGKLKDLPLANIVYVYDKPDLNTILLEQNRVIYLGWDMPNSLANPIQSEGFGMRVDLRLKQYYGDDVTCQQFTFDDVTTIPIQLANIQFLPAPKWP